MIHYCRYIIVAAANLLLGLTWFKSPYVYKRARPEVAASPTDTHSKHTANTWKMEGGITKHQVKQWRTMQKAKVKR